MDTSEASFDSELRILASERATEYRATALVGLVTCLDEEDLPYIQQALRVEAEPIKAAAILPHSEIIEEFASQLPKGVPFEYILQKLNEVALLHPRFQLCQVTDQMRIAKILDNIEGLGIAEKCVFVASPCDCRTTTMQVVLRALCKCVADQRGVSIVDVREIPLEVLDEELSNQKSYLADLEILHKAIILYLWLSYRFVNIFKDREMAMHAKTLVEEKINRALIEFSANPNLRNRLLLLKQLQASKPATVKPDTVASGKGIGSEMLLGAEEMADNPVLPLDWASASSASANVPTDDSRSMEDTRLANAHG